MLTDFAADRGKKMTSELSAKLFLTSASLLVGKAKYQTIRIGISMARSKRRVERAIDKTELQKSKHLQLISQLCRKPIAL
jgi:hypothetical protein